MNIFNVKHRLLVVLLDEPTIEMYVYINLLGGHRVHNGFACTSLGEELEVLMCSS